jgi:ABC-2 type transport system permease protein
MLLRTIFTKTVRDRWLAMAIAAVVLVLFMVYAMAIYSDIDLSIYTDLPVGLRELFGIPEGADVASLSYNVMLGFTGSVTLAGIAISMGASAIAGEERAGTMGLLLANPRSRTHVLLSKAASMVALTAAGSVVLLGASYAVPVLLDVDIGESHIDAMIVHLALNALFYGFGALAVGAWTGNRTLASGLATGVMIVSYVAAGLLPLVDSLSGLVRIFPWYYYDGSDPLINGYHRGHLAVLGGGCAVLAAAALIGVNRRDLRGRSVGGTLLDRLRANPATDRIFERLAGSTRVSRLWIKTVSEHQGLLLITSITMFGMMGVIIGPMYATIETDLSQFSEGFPEALLALAGGGEFTTPEGFYQIETYSLSAPVAIMIVTIVVATRGLAGEEGRRTMGLLLANPIRRSTVVLEQALAMTIYAAVVGVATFVGVVAGSILGGLGMSVADIAAATVLVTLLGLVFGALALALSAATGRVAVSVYGTVGAALASHLISSLLPLSDRFTAVARFTPHYYFLESDALVEGMHWPNGAVLTVLAMVLVGISVLAFERRDIRAG